RADGSGAVTRERGAVHEGEGSRRETREPFEGGSGVRRERHVVAHRAGQAPHDRLLRGSHDIRFGDGCGVARVEERGTGGYTSVLAEKADTVTATDLSPGMLALARDRTAAPNVTFRVEDCQKTSFPDAAFDTAFMSLVVHFTDPDTTLAEMRRILRPGGMLIILNLDMPSLRGLDRIRSVARVVLPGGPCQAAEAVRDGRDEGGAATAGLESSGFEVVPLETVRDAPRSTNIPVEYVRAVKR